MSESSCDGAIRMHKKQIKMLCNVFKIRFFNRSFVSRNKTLLYVDKVWGRTVILIISHKSNLCSLNCPWNGSFTQAPLMFKDPLILKNKRDFADSYICYVTHTALPGCYSLYKRFTKRTLRTCVKNRLLVCLLNVCVCLPPSACAIPLFHS